MAATHKKQLVTTVRPGSLLSNQDIIAVVTADTDIGGRIASVNDLRFSTAAGLWLEWMPIACSLVGGSLTATFRIVRPTILSSEDLVTEIHYGGTPDGSAPGPSSTFVYAGAPTLGLDFETWPPTAWSGVNPTAAGGSPTIVSGGIGNTNRVLFGASGGYLNLPATLDLGQQWTLSCWLTRAALGYQVIFTGNSSASHNFAWNSDFQSNVLAGVITAGGVCPLSSWNHWAVTCDGTSGTIFKDGVSVKTGFFGNAAFQLHRLFARATYDLKFTGYADDLRAYSRAQSPTELAYYVSQVNSPGVWGPEISLATGFKRLLKRRSLGQELYNGSLICG